MEQIRKRYDRVYKSIDSYFHTGILFYCPACGRQGPEEGGGGCKGSWHQTRRSQHLVETFSKSSYRRRKDIHKLLGDMEQRVKEFFDLDNWEKEESSS